MKDPLENLLVVVSSAVVRSIPEILSKLTKTSQFFFFQFPNFLKCIFHFSLSDIFDMGLKFKETLFRYMIL